MHLRFIFILMCSFIKTASAQPFTVRLKTDDTLFVSNLSFQYRSFLRTPDVFIERKRIGLETINEIYDHSSGVLYRTIQFRKRLCLARQLESGTISIYDFQIPEGRRIVNPKRISTNSRLYYHESNDSVLLVLNKINFEKIFDPHYESSYPEYETIKKKYLRLHTMGIFTAIMLPNAITAIGFQSIGFLIPYVAATTFVTGTALMKRQAKFNNVRMMARVYNQLK